MKHKNLKIVSKRKQQGIVLVTSMIFALVIAFVALSSIRESSLETRIVNLNQNKETTFQLAQSAIDQTIKTTSNFNSETEDESTTATITLTQQGFNTPSAAVLTIKPAQTVPGFDSSQLAVSHYEITGEAITSDNKVKTEILQGVTKIYKPRN